MRPAPAGWHRVQPLCGPRLQLQVTSGHVPFPPGQQPACRGGGPGRLLHLATSMQPCRDWPPAMRRAWTHSKDDLKKRLPNRKSVHRRVTSAREKQHPLVLPQGPSLGHAGCLQAAWRLPRTRPSRCGTGLTGVAFLPWPGSPQRGDHELTKKPTDCPVPCSRPLAARGQEQTRGAVRAGRSRPTSAGPHTGKGVGTSEWLLPFLLPHIRQNRMLGF